MTNDFSAGWQLKNTYAQLPALLHQSAAPKSFPAPSVVLLNRGLATELGLCFDGIPPETLADWFSGQSLPAGAEPIAQAYAGHQFGTFTMLGDGRALLIGEQETPCGQLIDIQYKGSGPTPFSRRGDGLAALGPMLREYVISEAMHALGIPTTRSLAVVGTGEPVFRLGTLEGAVLTRTAASHIRVGTFQFVATQRDPLALKALADYTIDRHYPELAANRDDKYLDFFRAVSDRQAALVASWQRVGFIHGVMNTDNVAISGETIDYGPCAFMDAYDPSTVFSSIDHGGRYAYANQPNIAHWNLVRFAECLVPLFHEDQEQGVAIAMKALDEFPERFESYWLKQMALKLGLPNATANDRPLVEELLGWMHENAKDFTKTFDDLTTGQHHSNPEYSDHRFQAWHAQWLERQQQAAASRETAKRTMLDANPAIIPRNHRVEEALSAATEHGDLSHLEQLVQALATPYERNEATRPYQSLPPASWGPYQTFCGT